ncbi:MAG: stage III sporulation protein AG [Oscillospiraceae bacterium]|nr:stage III sporulation protein AG [Oscillospiraceae bacterium]
MKNLSNWQAQLGRLGTVVGKYKYVCLVILAGVLLLLLPDKARLETKQTQAELPEDSCSVEEMEQKLEHALSQIEGAGQVTVVLTVKGGSRRVLAQDSAISQTEEHKDSTWNTVVISEGSGRESTVLLQQLSPEFRGALVVCSGGGDPTVRLKVVEAVAALTGLGSDRISVCKGT